MLRVHKFVWSSSPSGVKAGTSGDIMEHSCNRRMLLVVGFVSLPAWAALILLVGALILSGAAPCLSCHEAKVF